MNYSIVNNRPISCTFCGASVHGQVTETLNRATNTTEKICKWVCSRCNNLVKMGKVN